MLVCELEQMALQYDQQYNEIHSLLSHLQQIPSKWNKDNNSFYIFTVSSKRPNTYQLTLFRNNEPIFDMLRNDFKDISHELVLNDCKIDTINYTN